MIFKDRFDAAHQLAQRLSHYAHTPQVIIVAIPRGGLELGSVLAKELQAPLEVLFTKKIGYPGNPEYAIGAVSLETVVINPRVSLTPEISAYINEETQRLRRLLRERYHTYRGEKPPQKLTGKIVIVTDDGVATGATLISALELIRKEKPKKIIAALPVAPADALTRLKENADEVVCLITPQRFASVSQFYQRFEQVEDTEAIRLLKEASHDAL